MPPNGGAAPRRARKTVGADLVSARAGVDEPRPYKKASGAVCNLLAGTAQLGNVGASLLATFWAMSRASSLPQSGTER